MRQTDRQTDRTQNVSLWFLHALFTRATLLCCQMAPLSTFQLSLAASTPSFSFAFSDLADITHYWWFPGISLPFPLSQHIALGKSHSITNQFLEVSSLVGVIMDFGDKLQWVRTHWEVLFGIRKLAQERDYPEKC